MKSFQLIITDTAKADLRNIRTYIAKDSPKMARSFVNDLTTKLYKLADTGVIGTPRDNIKTGLRAFPYRGRSFYLHIIDNKMFVIRVLHGKQDISEHDFPMNQQNIKR